MNRLILILAILNLALGACNLPGDSIVPAETLEEGRLVSPNGLTPEITITKGEADTQRDATKEPATDFEAPPTEPPGEIEPAMSRLLPGDELVIQHITMIDVDTGWAVGGAAGRADSVLRSEDGGISWSEISPPEQIEDDTPMMAVGGFVDVSTAWVLYHPLGDARPGTVQALRIWHTSDAGEHWQASAPVSVEFVGSDHAHAWVRFTDMEQGWVMARYGGSGMNRYPVYLIRSQDGGANWQILEDPYEGLWLQSCPKTGWDWHPSGVGIITVGYCPFDSAEIHITTDSGQTWESVRLPFPPGKEERFGMTSCEAHSPILLSGNELMLASECPIWGDEPETSHLLYNSQDHGTSWQIWEYPGGQLYPIESDVILALGRDMYRSEDRGLTWTLLKQVAWDGQFSFVGPLSGWAVARDAGEIALVRTIDGGTSWQLVEPILVP